MAVKRLLLRRHDRTSGTDEAVQTNHHSVAAAAAGIAVVCIAAVLIVIGILAVFRHPDKRQVVSLLFIAFAFVNIISVSVNRHKRRSFW